MVLRYRGNGPAPVADVRRIEAAARVIDKTSRMLLVEVAEAALARLLSQLPSWVASEETTASIPDTQYRVARREG